MGEGRVERAPRAAVAPLLRLRVEVVDRLDGLDEDARDQVDDVDDGERLEQPVGGAVLVAVAAQDHERQRVADEADETEQADDADVDEDSERDVASARRRAVGPAAQLAVLEQTQQHLRHVGRLGQLQTAPVLQLLVRRNIRHHDDDWRTTVTIMI